MGSKRIRYKDEYYVFDLCDKVLGITSLRQYNKFDFLTGDEGKYGKCRRLPVDGYYIELNLVIEYKERQHTESINFFDKPDKSTVSGVHRGLQRRIYDERRRTLIPLNGLVLLEISYSDFNHNNQKRIVRNEDHDLRVVQRLLQTFLY
jgi:hypothetical protein